MVVELAGDLWDHFDFDVINDYSGIFYALSHNHAASAEALAVALGENLYKMQGSNDANFLCIFTPSATI